MKRALHRTGAPIRSYAGFTIAEVVSALLVLALVFGTAFGVMKQAFVQLDTARGIAAAGSILQTELERERLFSWDEVSNTSYRPTIDAGYASNPQIAGRFTLERAVTPMTGRETRMLQITLTVRWRALNGTELSRRLTTYYRNGGLYDYFVRSP